MVSISCVIIGWGKGFSLVKHQAPGVGVTKPISSILLISEFFSIVKTQVKYWISRLYLTGIITAEIPVKYECD